MKVLLFCALFGLSVANVCLKGLSQYRIRSTPCGTAVGWLNAGEQTNYRNGDSPVVCSLSGTSYTWIPITKMGGWVASAGVSACGGACVQVSTTGTVNVRSSPCGAVRTSYTSGVQKTLATATLNTCAIGGKQYAWVNTADGWVAVDFLNACSGTPAPPPPSGGCHTNARPTAIGQAGLDIITRWEGIVPCWYKDPVGYPTICIGHLITHNEYHQGQCLSTAQCQSLLRNDLGSYVSCVRNAITAPINQNQFDALVSFVYNLGCGSLQGSTLQRVINAGNYGAACGQIKLYVHAGGRVLQGLVNRRNDECNLFNSCGGVNFAGQYRFCPTADDCSACILNSENDATFAMYENLGRNTSCDATTWKDLAEDWCTNVNPWECYWKVNGLTGANNGTSQCPTCPARAEPTIPQPGVGSTVTCIADGALNMCGKEDCAVQLEGSTCDPLTGNCVMAMDNTPVLLRCNTTLPVDSAANHATLVLLVVMFLIALVF